MKSFRNDREKFDYFIDKIGSCWLWMGSLSRLGYGRFSYNGKIEYVHRLSWMFHHGPIRKGFHVVHDINKCGSKSCVNPKHLNCLSLAQRNKKSERLKFISDRKGNKIPRKLFIRAWNSSDSINGLADTLEVNKSFISNGRKRLRKQGFNLKAMTKSRDYWDILWKEAQKEGLIGGRDG